MLQKSSRKKGTLADFMSIILYQVAPFLLERLIHVAEIFEVNRRKKIPVSNPEKHEMSFYTLPSNCSGKHIMRAE